MNTTSVKLNSLYILSKPRNILLATLITTFSVFALYFTLKFYLGLYVLPLVAFLLYLFFMVKKPRLWIYSVVLFTIFFFRASEAGISVLDVFTALFLVGGIYIWLIYQILVLKKRIIKNFTEQILVTLYIFLPLNYIIAFFNGVSFMDWLRPLFLLGRFQGPVTSSRLHCR